MGFNKRPSSKRVSFAKVASWKRDQKLSNPAFSEYEILPIYELCFCHGFKISFFLALIISDKNPKKICSRAAEFQSFEACLRLSSCHVSKGFYCKACNGRSLNFTDSEYVSVKQLIEGCDEAPYFGSSLYSQR